VAHLDRPVAGVGHTEVFGLAARNRTVQLGIAEQGSSRAFVHNLGGLALRLQALPAHIAVPTGNIEGNDHAVPLLEVGDLTAHFFDDAHRLVPDHIAFVHVWPQDFIQVEV